MEKTNDQNGGRIPPGHIQEMIRKTGSPEQIAELEAKLEAAGQAPANKNTKQATAYLQANATPPEADNSPETIKKLAELFIARKIKGPAGRPPEVTYKLTRSILWYYYCQIVLKESAIDLAARAREKKKVLDGNVPLVFECFTYWLMGEPRPEDKGPGFDPEKSLVFWGDLGVGKSTLARAGQAVLAFYRQRFKWDARYYRLVSMDELFLETIATQNLDELREFRYGNWCLDELKEKHFTYKHYGNDIPLINTILLARHELWKRERLRTIITTNIAKARFVNSPSVFDDERLESRIAQEYELVEMRGPNWRKPGNRL